MRAQGSCLTSERKILVKFTRFAALGLAGALALSLAACGSSDSPSTGDSSASQTGDSGSKKDIRVWLVGETDTPQAAVDYLTTTFNSAHTDANLVVERQSWTGLTDKLSTVMASETDTPDVVEIGNTQASGFTSIGAFSDISDMYDELGGKDLLQGFVDAGTYDGKLYAVPYYAGSRLVFYRSDMFTTAGVSVPTTLQEYMDLGAKLKTDSGNPAFSGIWWPGQDWRNGLPYIWAAGGDLAKQVDGKWVGTLDTPEAIKGLTNVKTVMDTASAAAKDGLETDPQISWCADTTAMFSAPGWASGSLIDPKNGGCADKKDDIGVFALPGNTAGETAPIFLGGSVIGVAAKSQNQDLAKDALKILLSDEYQTFFAKAGNIPAKVSLAPLMGDTPVAKASAEAAKNSKLTPAAPGWANVEQDKIMEGLFQNIAQGGDVTELAKKASADITAAMNRG